MRLDEGTHGDGANARRRSPEDIVADILRSTERNISKTRIMYKAALNFKQLKRYLEILTKEGLLLRDPSSGRYRSSEKGTLYLERFDEFVKTRQMIMEKSKALKELFDGPGRESANGNSTQAGSE